ncbi:MAG: Ulp1 family isopeptidase, partial [Desulfosporosinus sp.]|nr:Ulp1 family isopeptidase [Desulfosporosinus sp.]
KIKVHPEISERDLIQWMIKHFHPRRRRAKKTAETTTRAITIPSTTGYASLDNSRADIRDTKQALKDLKKEQKNEIKAIKEAEKEDIQKLKDDLKLLKSASFPQLPPGSEEKKYSEADREQEIRKVEAIIDKKEKDAKDKLAKAEKEAKDKLAKAENDARDKLEKAEREFHNQLMDKEKEADRQRLKKEQEMLTRLEDEQKQSKTSIAENTGKFKTLAVEILKEKDELAAMNSNLRADATAEVEKKIMSMDKSELMKIGGIDESARGRFTIPRLREVLIDRGKLNKAEMINNVIMGVKEQNPKFAELQNRIDALEDQLKQLGEGRRNNEEMEKRGMSEDDIRKVMAPAGTKFLGTFAADEMHLVNPQRMKRFCFIMNTDPRSKPGEHWCAFFIDVRPHGSNSVEYYDPLADPISKEWFNDLKTLVKQVHPEDTYLRYKDNAIADQNDTSSNCGEFCCHFLLSRLANESFGRASGWDESGEPMIEKWKKANKKIWMSTQKGEGLRDIYDYVRKGATRIYQRIKD